MAVANLPLPLLLDSLLTSSWTWIAVSVATIATLLRALRISIFRHRLATQEALQPPSPNVSEESEKSPCSLSLQNTFKRRTRSKSTSSLEKLPQSQDGILRSGLGFLSFLLDIDMSPAFRKVTSASRIFNGQSECGRGESANHRPGLLRDAIEHKLGLGSDEVGLGFVAYPRRDSKNGEIETPSRDSIRVQSGSEDDLTSGNLLSSWAFSLRESPQNPLFNPSFPPYYGDYFSSSKVPPYFEKQFGWDKLLQTRLGSPWKCQIGSVFGLTQCKEPTVESQRVVKVWSDQQKKLFKTLKIEESSTFALDVSSKDGLACIGNERGDISLWDIGDKACVSIVSSDVNPVSALSMNSEKEVTIAGNGNVLGLWDQKSPIYMPILDWNKTPNNQTPFVALKSRENGLCITQTDGVFSMYDLRKLQGERITTGLLPEKPGFLLKAEEEEANNLWEKLACDVEEESWDECNASPMGDGNSSEKSTHASFMSRCLVFIRSLSASAP